jgi:MED7 protein
MAAELIKATFPAPPPFYKNFTTANLERLKEFEDANPPASDSDQKSSEASQWTPQRLLALPPELRFLVPPIPPVDEKLQCFGDQLDVRAEQPSSQLAHTLMIAITAARPSPNSQRHRHRTIVPRSSRCDRRFARHTITMDAGQGLLSQKDRPFAPTKFPRARGNLVCESRTCTRQESGHRCSGQKCPSTHQRIPSAPSARVAHSRDGGSVG